MARRYSRGEFLARLRSTIGQGSPLVMTGAGNGIAAKFIERGGVDILGVYNTGYFRMQGYGSLAGMLPMADANHLVFEMGRREVLPQVKDVPVIAGLNGVVSPVSTTSPLWRGLTANSAGPWRVPGWATNSNSTCSTSRANWI